MQLLSFGGWAFSRFRHLFSFAIEGGGVNAESFGRLFYRGAGAKTHTAITDIPTTCQAQEFPGVETVSLKGLNTSLKLSANATVMFPKVFSDAGVGLAHSAGGAPILDEFRFTLVFDSAQTLASNAAGESLGAAFSRLVANVQSLGY